MLRGGQGHGGQGRCAQGMGRTRTQEEQGRCVHGPPAPGTGTLRSRNAQARAGGQPGHLWGRTVARQRRERTEMGLVSRGAAEAGLGTASAAVRPGPPDAVPNPIPTPPAEGADREQPVSNRGAGRRPCGATLGSRPLRAMGPDSCRGGHGSRPGSPRVSGASFRRRRRPFASRSLYFLICKMGTPLARVGLRLGRAVRTRQPLQEPARPAPSLWPGRVDALAGSLDPSPVG